MLRSTLLPTLRESGARVVIFSPFANDASFKAEFNGTHEPLVVVPFSPLARLALRLREILLKSDHPVLADAQLIMHGTRARRVIRTASARERLLQAARRIIRPLRGALATLFDKLEERLLRVPQYEHVCRTYNPSTIILGTCDADPQDIVWLTHARWSGAKAVVVDLPWNYFDDRMFSPPRPSTICAWNEDMVQHLRERFDLDSKKVSTVVTGCLRYDKYARSLTLMPREEFLRSMGADPARISLVYFLSGSHWNPHQAQIVRLILESVSAGAIRNNPQLIVRFGPHEKGLKEEFKILKEEYPDLVFDWAEETPQMDRVINLLAHSAASLSIFSSIALDAAAFDKPMIYTGFSGFAYPHEDDTAAARVYEFDFVRRALKTKGVRIAYDAKSLIELINQGMENPEADAAGRKVLVKKFLGNLDGKAGDRIARVIENTQKIRHSVKVPGPS